ncbi:MAG: protein kinase domain-containing protein, partial [Chthoniobacterales bacterium]
MSSAAAAKTTTCTRCGTAFETAESSELGCMICMLHLGFANAGAVSEAEQFGQYMIEKHDDGRACELGRGAMGVTYRATDMILQRAVALKIIGLERTPNAEAARERFLREARAAAALRHPNISTVHQFGIHEESGQCFYAMELIEGETLEERVRRNGPLDLPMTIEIARQVTSALLAAEACRLVHRDIKPANLMMIDGGDDTAFTIKVIDFGVAKALAETSDPRFATHGGFIGTPAFASPEQWSNQAVDVRSDIYSLGATLWYLLTGRTPFGEPDADGSVAPPPLEQRKAAGVASRFRSLLLAMLAREPAARPGVSELARKLEAMQKPKRATLLLGVAAVLALGGLVAYWAVTSRLSPQNRVVAPEKSIAVLPFENLSRDPDNAFFTDGVQDEILTDLAKVAELKVISRTSVISYRDMSGRNLRK